MKSMTGFGRARLSSDFFTLEVEARSLNSKTLDIRISIPRSVSFLFEDFNQTVKSFVKRGKVDISLKMRFSPDFSPPLSVNYGVAKSFLSAVEKIAAVSGRSIDISARDLLSFHDIFLKEDPPLEDYRDVFLKALEEALNELDRSREAEGQKIKEDIAERLRKISSLVESLEKKIPSINEQIKAKLREKLSELISNSELSSRLELEMAILAERHDASEELTRLKVHISKFFELLSKDFVGKTLDFLCQEMHREITTLSNKVRETDILDEVLQIKTEIARIKEQVQNVE